MNESSKGYREIRQFILFIILVIGIIATLIYSQIYKNSNIVKESFKVCINNDTKEIFEYQFNDKKKFYKYYDYEISSIPNEADFIFTSNIDEINTESEYTIEGYSPLIICLKDTENAKNYLKTNTKSGFLTCNDDAKKIEDSSTASIICDFRRIIDVILKNGDWSDLGGEDKKITIYYPTADSVEGKLFYEFLLITLNNGKYPESNLEEIKLKAQEFLDSPYTVQTDVSSKLSKLGDEVQENDIYILFESDFLKAANREAEILVTYPELTVIKQLYLQFNNVELQDKIQSILKDSSGWELSNTLRQEIYYKEYRNSYSPDLRNSEGNKTTSFNVQDGFNYYELSN